MCRGLSARADRRLAFFSSRQLLLLEVPSASAQAQTESFHEIAFVDSFPGRIWLLFQSKIPKVRGQQSRTFAVYLLFTGPLAPRFAGHVVFAHGQVRMPVKAWLVFDLSDGAVAQESIMVPSSSIFIEDMSQGGGPSVGDPRAQTSECILSPNQDLLSRELTGLAFQLGPILSP